MKFQIESQTKSWFATGHPQYGNLNEPIYYEETIEADNVFRAWQACYKRFPKRHYTAHQVTSEIEIQAHKDSVAAENCPF